MRKLVFAFATMFSAAVPVAALAEGYGGNDATPPTYADDQYRYYNRYDNRADAYDPYRDNRYRDTGYRGERARVVETKALTEPGSGREECWNPSAGHYEELRTDNSSSDHKNLAGTIIGGIAGGVLGHQVGSGRGNTAATVGGAALGAYAGNRVENNRHENNSQSDLDRSNCRTIGASGNVQSYEVRYNWQGRDYITRMDHDPGRFVELGRDVNADGTPYSSLAQGDWR
jgi:uncharacterized protein YcfJ